MLERFGDLTQHRNTQLDGWRAFAVVGVMWHHWVPPGWRGPWPFEMGLYFFLTLTGFLITRILLRERDLGEASQRPWRLMHYGHFQKRRMLRILIPCYVAMLFALAVGARDIRENVGWYFSHLSNFHMAGMTGWPSGTAHYWTLAIQMQFYLIWPWVVFLTPRRAMVGVFLACVAVAPLSRVLIEAYVPLVHHVGAISTTALDYFGVGALLALGLERGMEVGNVRLKWAAWLAGVGYVWLYASQEMGHPVVGLQCVRQTLIAVVFAGLISSTLVGFSGWLGRLLDHGAVQEVGRLSFGLYLFHTPVPLMLGWVLPQLWGPFFVGPYQAVRVLVFALTAWGLAVLCRKYLESGAAPLSKRGS
jgi:peptidoglycan/LPS O-acetylase OafA/YrhL